MAKSVVGVVADFILVQRFSLKPMM